MKQVCGRGEGGKGEGKREKIGTTNDSLQQIKNIQRLLRQIENLEEQQRNGNTLDAAAQEKIAQKDSLQQQLQELESTTPT